MSDIGDRYIALEIARERDQLREQLSTAVRLHQEAQARIAELEKDKARLDFIQSYVDGGMDESQLGAALDKTGSIREAIDADMANAATKEKSE